MGVIKIRSKEKISNLDSLNSKDAHALAILKKLDILTYVYTISYAVEIELLNNEGDPATSIKVLDEQTSAFSPQQIQALFEATGKDIASGENFDDEIRDIVTTALIYQVVTDQRFGLGMEDWEVVSG